MTMILNPNLEIRKGIAKEVKNNDGYCPCLLLKNEDTKCPCRDKRYKEVCICGLYVKAD